MLIRHREATPEVDPSAFVAPTAALIGRVQVDARARILYGAVLDSEGSSVRIGESSIVSENAVLRATAAGEVEAPLLLSDHVFVGPHATLLGCTVEACSFIATGATVLQGAVIERGGVVAVGALVHARTVIPGDFFVPPNAIAIGHPVTLYGPHDGKTLIEAIRSLEFSKTAFGVEVASRDRASIYHDVTEVRSEEYQAHFEDVVLTEVAAMRADPREQPDESLEPPPAASLSCGMVPAGIGTRLGGPCSCPATLRRDRRGLHSRVNTGTSAAPANRAGT